MNAATPVPSIFDLQSLSALKSGVKQDDPQALKAAARQFEAVFLQMVLKSMRAATPQDGIFDSEQTRFYQELLDQQLSQTLSARGGTGLAAVIERQLSRQDATPADFPDGLPLGLPPAALPLETLRQINNFGVPAPQGVPRALPLDRVPVQPALPAVPRPVAPPSGASAPGVDNVAPDGTARGFVAATLPHALAASRETGIPAHFLVAHAALETGWGKHEPRFADGRPSHNLFGIKAGGTWRGAVVEARTTEYVNGAAESRVERFRAYGSPAESFRDYARLLAGSPRYAGVLGSQDAATFARGLQRAGYATDPDYAAKLEGIIHGPTLRQALIG